MKSLLAYQIEFKSQDKHMKECMTYLNSKKDMALKFVFSFIY